MFRLGVGRLTEEDEVTKLNERLEKVREALVFWKSSGIDEELLVIYLHDKTKVPKREIRRIFKSTEDFFKALGVRLVLKKAVRG